MLVKNRTTMILPQQPICPNCGVYMDLAEPDEFFETYAYYCNECGIRTRECDSPDEAYATIRHRPLYGGYLSNATIDEKWELFDDITTAHYGKMMYALNDDGTVYSRYSGKEMTFEDAVNEFKSYISID